MRGVGTMDLFGWFRNKPLRLQNHSVQSAPISSDISVNISFLRTLFTLTPDLVIREFNIKQTGSHAVLVYLDGMTDKNSINNNILLPLMYQTSNGPESTPTVAIGHASLANSWVEIEKAILQGKSILFVNSRTEVSVFDTQGWPQRAVTDPQLEPSLKGAHQGLVETGSQSIALIRRYIPNRELKIKELTVGQRGQTKLSILYLEDVANPQLLGELEE
jgi:spore germination protein